MKKDYYKILEIDENEKKLDSNEFNKILKNKYRELCKKWHPDRCHDESKVKEYEEKFKDITEAYAVLSDDKKRAEYDNPTQDFNFDFSSFQGNFNDIFDIFSFGDFNEKKVYNGQSIRIKFNVTLEDIFNGVKKTIKYKRNEKCPDCHGTGAVSNSEIKTCDTCHGTGNIFTQKGFFQEIRTCHKCNGKGKIIINPCTKCNGSGFVLTENTIELDIPKGVDNTYHYIVKNGGNAPIGNGKYGDLIVIFNEIPHPKFKRCGENIYFNLNISVIDAILGGETEIETIDNKKLKIKIKQGTEDGTEIRIKGKGLPILNSNNFGDMIGVVKIIIPKKLNNDEIKILENLRDSENFIKND